MILTVTPNPSLDRTYTVDGLVPGEVNRARADTVEASGKGVNVSRALHAAGLATVAVLPAGGAEGVQLRERLDADRLRYHLVPVAGATRTNVTLAEPGGRTTKVNAPGQPLSTVEYDRLVSTVEELAAGAGWVVVSGSLPPGAGPDLLPRLIGVARSAGARAAVDASGRALAEAAPAGADLLAPNAAELAALVERELPAAGPELVRAALAAARVAHARWGPALLVSLGADGVLWWDGRTALHAMAPPVVPVNTAGAGDALLAGWLSGGARRAEPDAEWRIVTAAAWGTAACLLAGTAGDVAATAHPEAVALINLGHEPGTPTAHAVSRY